MMRVPAFVTSLALAVAIAGTPALSQIPVPPGPASPPTATPAPTAAPRATAAPAGPAVLATFTAQLLDVRDGFVYFTTGDAFRISPGMPVVADETGAPFSGTPHVGMFARATLNDQGQVIRLAVTTNRLALDRTYADVKRFAVAQSTVAPAPEIRGPGLSGKPVTVQFIVRVPPATAVNAAIYVSTDASGWNPTAYRMDRVDGEHYRITRTFASGTRFAYRYTRGSWTAVERGQNGLETDPRTFSVREVDVLVQRDTVWRWSDDANGAPQIGPDAIPTPFNPDPFGGLSVPGRGGTKPGPRLPGPATPPPPNNPR